jgi:hypothetical protein
MLEEPLSNNGAGVTGGTGASVGGGTGALGRSDEITGTGVTGAWVTGALAHSRRWHPDPRSEEMLRNHWCNKNGAGVRVQLARQSEVALEPKWSEEWRNH